MQNSLTQSTPLARLLAVLLAALVIAGCASSSSRDQTPQEPAQEPERPEVVTPPAPPEPPEPKDFDAAGNPLDANGRPLSLVYYFDYDKSTLKPSDLASLEQHAQILRRNPDRSVVLEGHCDERGTREYNLALGERRSDTVRSFLESAGVSSRQLETVSYGEERPQDPGHNDAAWARNRRAILSYR